MRITHLLVGAAILMLPGCGGGGGSAGTVPITITTSASSLPVAGTAQFSATIPNIASPRIVWSVQEGAAGGTITQSGLYTAPALAGTYHVVASGPLYNNAQATSAVVVHVIVGISPTQITTTLGQVVSFSSTVTGSSNTGVTWSVQEGATGGTITAAGVYTAPATTPGIYHVVATSNLDSTQQAVATVAVGYGSATGTIQ